MHLDLRKFCFEVLQARDLQLVVKRLFVVGVLKHLNDLLYKDGAEPKVVLYYFLCWRL